MLHRLSRRGFLGASAAAVSIGRTTLSRAQEVQDAPSGPVRVHCIYAGRPRQAWPKPAFDPRAEMERFERALQEMKPALAGVELTGGQLVQTPEEAARAVAAARQADGILLVHLTLGVLPLMQKIVEAGKPTVVFSQPFSGHEWMFVRQWQREGRRIVLLATSDMGEIAPAVRLLRVPALMARSRIVAVPGRLDGSAPACSPEKIKATLGCEVVPVSYDRLSKAHEAIDPKQAEAEAEQVWTSQAKRIVEPTREEIVKSARMYLAMRETMRAERAQAITINCLGGLPIDKLGYPCLAFSRLDDMGLVGACESDIDSTLTKLMFAYGFGVPGFITDPLFDTAKNAVIHAHCTGPTRMDGPAGKRAPFIIRTHTDDDKGAALEVEYRVGQVITCAKLVNLDTMMLTTGRITEVTDFEDRGCRTQITTQVTNAARLLENWGAGLVDGWMPQLHRVVFYGDHTSGVTDLGQLMGFRVIEAM